MKINLVNYEYMKLYRFDIFLEMQIASEKNDDIKLDFFKNMYRIIINYEKTNRIHLNEFYIRIEDIKNFKYFKTNEITIERENILNAILFAVYNNDIKILNKLRTIPIQKSEITQEELGENLDYILNHSINISEYIIGEEERFVYNINEHRIEKTYIFNSQENKSYHRLKIKQK